MEISRRSLILSSVALQGRILARQENVPWYSKLRRCGQVNFNDRDPETLDIKWWLDYWTGLKDSLYVQNLGGGIRAVTGVKKLGEMAGWFNADHQGRTGNTPMRLRTTGPRRALRHAGRTITNVTGAYANSQPLWRHTSKSAAEATMWLASRGTTG